MKQLSKNAATEGKEGQKRAVKSLVTTGCTSLDKMRSARAMRGFL